MVGGADLDQAITQAEFAELMGVSQQKVSQLLGDDILSASGTCRTWIQNYCHRLREQAAGRLGAGGDLDLVQERAALAKEQREHYRIKNAAAKADYAPTRLLADVLAVAAAAVVDRIDALPSQVRNACPRLPPEAFEAVDLVITAARKEWIRATAELVMQRVDVLADDDSVSADACESPVGARSGE